MSVPCSFSPVEVLEKGICFIRDPGPRHPLAQVCEAIRFHIGASVIGQTASDVM